MEFGKGAGRDKRTQLSQTKTDGKTKSRIYVQMEWTVSIKMHGCACWSECFGSWDSNLRGENIGEFHKSRYRWIASRRNISTYVNSS